GHPCFSRSLRILWTDAGSPDCEGSIAPGTGAPGPWARADPPDPRQDEGPNGPETGERLSGVAAARGRRPGPRMEGTTSPRGWQHADLLRAHAPGREGSL